MKQKRSKIAHEKKEANQYEAEMRDILQAFPVESFFVSTVEERTKQWNRLDKLWDPLCSKFAWACPDRRALSILEHFAPLVEIGAGKGYWCSLLQHRGVDIAAFDKRGGKTGIKMWTEVHRGGPEKLLETSMAQRNLFLCYPDEDESISIVCLENFSGDYVIHVGELMVGDGTCGGRPQAPWGRTSSSEFQVALASSFNCVLVARLQTRLPFSRDCITVWKRTRYVIGRNFPPTKFLGGKYASEKQEDDMGKSENSDDDDSSYADFNRSYFASLHEQEKMLADKFRMDFYHKAIKKFVKPGSVVIDLGTGTGILAAFAEKAGASKVYAIDHSKAALSIARKVAEGNNLNHIEWIQQHSSSFKLDKANKVVKVDILLHEQMGDCLFDEDMVKNVCDVRDRLLRPGGMILPSCFDLFIEPVELNKTRHVPFIWDLKVHGIDFTCLKSDERQDDEYYHLRSCDPQMVDHFLSNAEPAYTLDLNTIIESDIPLTLTYSRTVTQKGHLDGFVVYFRSRIGHDLTLSTGPHDGNRAPHWGYRILRDDSENFAVGDNIEITIQVGRWADLNTWRWSHKKILKGTNPSLVKKSSESTSAFSFVSAAELAVLRGGSSGSKRKVEEERKEDDDDEDEEEDEEEELLGNHRLSAVQKRREFDLDAQFHEDDDKKWTCVHPDELLPDRAIQSLTFLLDK